MKRIPAEFPVVGDSFLGPKGGERTVVRVWDTNASKPLTPLQEYRRMTKQVKRAKRRKPNWRIGYYNTSGTNLTTSLSLFRRWASTSWCTGKGPEPLDPFKLPPPLPSQE